MAPAGPQTTRAVLFAEIAAREVEKSVLDLKRNPDTPLQLLASELGAKMIAELARVHGAPAGAVHGRAVSLSDEAAQVVEVDAGAADGEN